MTDIRKQIADTLRYLRKHHEKSSWLQRSKELREIERRYDSIPFEELERYCDEIISCGVKKEDILISSECEDDCDGYPSRHVVLSVYEEQSDNSYFDTLCDYLLPSASQIDQYQTYLRLKAIYEGK